jgi:hypothetical protein
LAKLPGLEFVRLGHVGFGATSLPLTHIHTCLVYPAKGIEVPDTIGGSELPLDGTMFRLLRDVYDRAETECDVAIWFNQDNTGAQRNACRDLLVAYPPDAASTAAPMRAKLRVSERDCAGDVSRGVLPF